MPRRPGVLVVTYVVVVSGLLVLLVVSVLVGISAVLSESRSEGERAEGPERDRHACEGLLAIAPLADLVDGEGVLADSETLSGVMTLAGAPSDPEAEDAYDALYERVRDRSGPTQLDDEGIQALRALDLWISACGER